MDPGQDRMLDAVARLAGGIAHDLNNALLPLRAYGEIALRKIARGEDASAEVEEMLVAASRTSALTQQLVAFSGNQVLQPEVVDLNDLVSELEHELETELAEGGALRVALHRRAVPVLADRRMLEHALVDLVRNAGAGIGPGGTVTIAVTADGAPLGAELRICDTGRGMDAETAAHVFEPFFAFESGGRRGLGLASAHGIVKQSGGTIDVETAPGEGCAFVIRLPLLEPADEPAPLKPASIEMPGATVLLVEDDPAVRRSIERMLAIDGYGVVAAADGEEAIRVAASRRVDLLLTDVAMPGLNGRETAERIKETHPDVPIVFMSGYTDDVALRQGICDCAAAFLQKPFGADELTRALDGALVR